MNSVRSESRPFGSTWELEPGTQVGDYVITGKLGEGGMATVYSAKHPLIGKRVAVKVISRALSGQAEAVERFLQEARCANQIGHPNIVDVFNWGTLADGRCYFIMEWLQGRSLAAYIDSCTLSLVDKIDSLIQICDALEAAHAHGVVHRDLKPDNIFLVPMSGRRKLVKLLDFGLAKLTAPGELAPRLTRTGLTMGTPEYISPEQARGRNVDHRTDIYALGVLAYELFLGRLPFIADSAADILALHLKAEVPAPVLFWPEIPNELEELILGLMKKDPADRPTLGDTRSALLALRRKVHGTSDERDLLIADTPRLREVSYDGGSLSPIKSRETPFEGELRATKPSRKMAVAKKAAGFAGFALVGAISALLLQPQSSGPTVAAASPMAPLAATPADDSHARRAELSITVNVPAAEIRVDGQRIIDGGAGARITFPRGGVHEVEVSAPGRVGFRTQVTLSPGARVEVPVLLARAEEPRAPQKRVRPLARRDEYFTVDPFTRNRSRRP